MTRSLADLCRRKEVHLHVRSQENSIEAAEVAPLLMHGSCSMKCASDPPWQCCRGSLAYAVPQMSRKLVRTQTTTNSESTRNPFLFWSRSLLPIALAVSAGSLALHPQSDPSLCEAPSVNSRAKVVVKGSHKEVPRELIDELKAICQDNMTLDYEERYNHGKPQNSFHKAVNIPDVVVFPR
ncbi:FAD-linked oxidases family protein [Prunus dulcis]|uniref:FAD-linked oxidases family protein n=1 Tax=Prunus dulcis TaxID=3755 RepID=A0A4Y1RP12_PRUDU|nr:FAD-linked oxidases family protein [Prunus dulcis]